MEVSMSSEVKKTVNPEKNINTTSIEELINSNLDSAAEEVLMAEGASVEVSASSQKEVAEAKTPKEIDLDELLDAADIELGIEPEPEPEPEPESEIQVEAELEELNEGLGSEPVEVATAMTLPEDAKGEEASATQAESAEAPEQSGSIDSLESEVSELESEIQTQMDKLVVKADHLKANIQNEIKRVSADNEQLQQQVAELTQQLSAAEEKIRGLVEVQDRQQVTIQKLIRILKGINTKITHLYDEG
jgi:DNA repair exonuclease SbcCD ATPase subunit